jgi:hypothetical protein
LATFALILAVLTIFGAVAFRRPGAYIELQVQGTSPGLWSSVQWKDEFESWNEVNSWQGELDEDGRKSWWIDPEDFGTGPFRWVVKDGQGGSILAVSEAFLLPDDVNQTMVTTLALGTAGESSPWWKWWD